MTNPNGRSPRAVLQQIAHRAMIERGLEPDFTPALVTELAAIPGPADVHGIRDLRQLLWCSIDNDDSRDLDQLSVAERLADGRTILRVAIADVSSLVRLHLAIDHHASQNTTSVYTAAQIFPMLPERLSTDLTSLNPHCDRRAIVVEMEFDRDGEMRRSDVYEAAVHNHAQLAYDSTAAWFEGTGPMPARLAAVDGLAENLKWQDEVARKLRAVRHERGALSLETIHARPVFDGGMIRELEPERSNRAKALIEDLMIAANGVTAGFLAKHGFPSVRRIVRTPKNWERIVTLVAERGTVLPAEPDGRALGDFLVRAQAEDPLRFPDLSLSIVKLIGAGEYVMEFPGRKSVGHFGLAVRDYTHSTAPNRRFPDLISQRLVKAVLAGKKPPYSAEELTALALHCTEQEDAAKKVERQVTKSAAAMLLGQRIGEQFEGLITGAADKGTWVRLLSVPVEGRLVAGFQRLEVGQRVRVKLVFVDIERGYIDFVREG